MNTCLNRSYLLKTRLRTKVPSYILLAFITVAGSGACRPALAFAQQADPDSQDKPVDVLNPDLPDLVVSLVDGSVLRGRIVTASSETILFRATGKNNDQSLPTKEYQIRFCNGLTNAAELNARAQQLIEQAGRELNDLKYGAVDELEGERTYLNTMSRAGAILMRIRSAAVDPDDLPAIPEFTKPDRDALSARRKNLAAVNSGRTHARTARSERVDILKLQRSCELNLPSALNLRNDRLKSIDFSDVIGICEDIGARYIEAPARRSKRKLRGGEIEVQRALTELTRLCEVASRSQAVTRDSIDLNNGDANRRLIAEFQRTWEKSSRIGALGPRTHQAVTKIVKWHDDIGSLLDEYETHAKGLREVIDDHQFLTELVRDGRVKRMTDLQKQLSSLSERIQKVGETCRAADTEATRALLKEVSGFQTTFTVSRDVLTVRVELPVATDALKSYDTLDSRVAAIDLRQRLAESASVLEVHKKLTQALPAGEFRIVARIYGQVTDHIELCRTREFEFLAETTREQLDQLVVLNAAVITTAIENQTHPIQQLQQAHHAASELATSFAGDIKDLSRSSPPIDRLTADLKQVRDEFELSVRLFENQKQVDDVPISHADLTSLTAAENQLAKARETFTGFERAAVSRKALPIYSQTESLLKNRAEALTRVRVQINLKTVSDGLAGQFQGIETDLSRQMTSSARVQLFAAGQNTSRFKEILSGSVLAEDPERQAELEALSGRYSELSAAVAEQIRKRKQDAGWLVLPVAERTTADESQTEEPLIEPGAKTDWLIIESHVSLLNLEDATAALDQFAERHPSEEWKDRISGKRAEIALYRGREFEGQSDLTSAESSYRQAQQFVPNEHPAHLAAAAAIGNVEQAVRSQNEQRGSGTRMLALVSLAVCCVLGVGIGIRRESSRHRLREVDRLMQRVRAAQRSHGSRNVEQILQSAGQTLATVTGTPEASASRDTSGVTLLDPRPPAERSVVVTIRQASTPGDNETVEEIIRLEKSDELSARLVAGWLPTAASRTKRSKKLKPLAVEWLQKTLAPSHHDVDADLDWKLQLNALCVENIPETKAWSALFAMRCAAAVGDFATALTCAGKISLKRLHQKVASEVVVTTARALIETGSYSKAVKFIDSTLSQRRFSKDGKLQRLRLVALSCHARDRKESFELAALNSLIRAATDRVSDDSTQQLS